MPELGHELGTSHGAGDVDRDDDDDVGKEHEQGGHRDGDVGMEHEHGGRRGDVGVVHKRGDGHGGARGGGVASRPAQEPKLGRAICARGVACGHVRVPQHSRLGWMGR